MRVHVCCGEVDVNGGNGEPIVHGGMEGVIIVTVEELNLKTRGWDG